MLQIRAAVASAVLVLGFAEVDVLPLSLSNFVENPKTQAPTGSASAYTFGDAVMEAAWSFAAFAAAGLILGSTRKHRKKQRAFTKEASKAFAVTLDAPKPPARTAVEATTAPRNGIQHSTCGTGAQKGWSASVGAATRHAGTNNCGPPWVAGGGGSAATTTWRRAQPRQGCGSEHNEGDVLAAAVRNGKAAELPRLLEAARMRAAARGAGAATIQDLANQHLLSSLRSCAAGRYFQEALAAYDHEATHVGVGCTSLWSLLLYCAVETQCFDRCDIFFNNLCKIGLPSGNDFVNMVRYQLRHGDVQGVKNRLADLRCKGFNLDCVSRNRALQISMSSHAFDFAELLADEQETGSDMDTVAYNTLIKGFGQAKKATRCSELYSEMQSRGLAPSDVTYGTMLDALIDSRELVRAKEVFADLRNSGLKMNVVHYTVFIKGLTSAGFFDDALAVLNEMTKSRHTKPDLVTYSTLVKAHADQGNVDEAMRLLDCMLEQGVQPDAIIFNVVLGTCAVRAVEAAAIFDTFEKLLQRGLRTTTSTLSIMLKALSKSSAWDASFDLLESSEKRYGIVPEVRLYTQLAQACAAASEGAHVVRAYAALVRSAELRGSSVDQPTHARFGRLASSCGQADVAVKLFEASTQSRSCLKVIDSLVAEAWEKHKSVALSWRAQHSAESALVASLPAGRSNSHSWRTS